MNKILITGAGGYLGSLVTEEALRYGYKEVIAVDTFVNGKEGIIPCIFREELTVLKRDILDLRTSDFDGVDKIIHLASLVGTNACLKDPNEALRTNLEGTIHLAHEAQNIPIIFTNTNIGYPSGNSDETAELTPQGIYSQTKIEAEKVILEHGGISLRLGSVFGLSPKMRHDLLLNFLVKECVSKMTIEGFDMDSSRNFIHVRDVARILACETDSLKKGEAYNLAIQRHYTKKELMKIIETELQRTIFVKIGNQKDPDKRDYYLSMAKFFNACRYQFQYSVEKGVSELVKYYEYQSL